METMNREKAFLGLAVYFLQLKFDADANEGGELAIKHLLGEDLPDEIKKAYESPKNLTNERWDEQVEEFLHQIKKYYPELIVRESGPESLGNYE